MGAFLSGRRTSRSEVKEVKKAFHHLSQTIERYLPWIGLARNGAAVLLPVATIFMFTAISDEMWPAGGRVAGALVTLVLVLHMITAVLRERMIERTNDLLDNFYKVVPEYMDTSNIPKLQRDGWLFFFFILLFEVFSLLVGFLFSEGDFVWKVFAAFIVLGVSAGKTIWMIVRGENDFQWVNTCKKCTKTLGDLLKTTAANNEGTVINLEER